MSRHRDLDSGRTVSDCGVWRCNLVWRLVRTLRKIDSLPRSLTTRNALSPGYLDSSSKRADLQRDSGVLYANTGTGFRLPPSLCHWSQYAGNTANGSSVARCRQAKSKDGHPSGCWPVWPISFRRSTRSVHRNVVQASELQGLKSPWRWR